MSTVIVGGVLVLRLATRSDSVETSDTTDHAIMVDLPAALTSSQAVRDAQEGPEQAPSAAAPDVPAPPPITELKPDTPPDPVDTPKTVDTPKPVEPTPLEPPKTVLPQMPVEDPVAIEPPKPVEPPKPIEPPKPVETPPKQQAAPTAPSPAVIEQAPTGSETPVVGEHPESDEGQPRPSPRAITAWQRSLVGRIEVAKRMLAATGHQTAIGTVQVAFAIDREGRIVTERVARSSGFSDLDDTALSLVRHAAPFPLPPLGTGDRDLSFIVPIRFRH